jgi:hypothetical protein
MNPDNQKKFKEALQKTKQDNGVRIDYLLTLVDNLKCCANCIHGFHTEMRDHIMINCQVHEKLPAMATAVCEEWEWDEYTHEDREVK